MQAYAANDDQETMDVTIVERWIAEDGLQLECLFDLYRSVNNGEKEKVSSKLETMTSGVDWQYTFGSVPKSDSMMTIITHLIFVFYAEQCVENTSAYRYNGCKEVRENANQ